MRSNTKAEELAARLESGWCPIESPADMERAAAELRRLAAVEAERDALLEMLKEARQMVFEWGSNAQDLFDLLPQDLARIDAAIDAAMKGTT